LFKSRHLPGCTAAGRIPWEFANRQLGDTERRDVQLIFQEIDAASRSFSDHSANLVKSYL
jgi:hypothetical protein